MMRFATETNIMSQSLPSSYTTSKYQADGGFTISGLAPFFGISAIAGAITGYAAGWVSQWFYLVLLFPIVIGAAVGAVGGTAIRIGKVRVPWLCGLAGFLAGTLACFSMYMCEYSRFEAELEMIPPEFREMARNLEQFQARRAELPKEIQEFVDELAQDEQGRQTLAIDGFFDYMDVQAQNGVEIGRATDVNKKGGMNLGYTGSYIYWGIELLIVAGISFAMMKGRAAEPFCIHCENWKTTEELGRVAGDQPSVVEALETGRLSEIKAGAPMPSGLILSIFECQKCGADSTIDLGLVRTDMNDKGEASTTKITMVTYPGDTAESIHSIFTADLNAAVASPMDEAFQQIEGQTSEADVSPTSANSFRLTVISDYGENEQLISEAASNADVVEQMQSLDWNGFHQVILQQENGDLIEVGGSLNPDDGFSIIYLENEEEFVVKEPPTNVEQMLETLTLYLAADPRWKTQYEWE
jgi:hypothetical protein